MATAEIHSGICGFSTQVKASQLGDYQVEIIIKSDCPDIQKIAQSLHRVDALREISFRQGEPEVLLAGKQYCSHASCPVPAGIIKAVEIEAGLALPKDVIIKLRK